MEEVLSSLPKDFPIGLSDQVREKDWARLSMIRESRKRGSGRFYVEEKRFHLSGRKGKRGHGTNGRSIHL